MNGQLPVDEWPTLAYQGLADLVMRLDQDGNTDALVKRLGDMPAPVLENLCPLLENVQPSPLLQQALTDLLRQALSSDDSNRVAALARALSNIADEPAKQDWVMEVLNSHHATRAEVITVIATRCESALLEPRVLQSFLEQLAQGEAGQTGFSRILAELMFMPVHRALILQAFRQNERSPQLEQAIGEMFGQSFTAPTSH